MILNNNYNNQFNKISSNNINSISIDNTQTKMNRRKRIRILSENINETCDESKVFCLNNKQITDIIQNNTGSSLGFKSQLNKNKNIPILTNSSRQIFSINSLDFEISMGDSKQNFRRLDLEEFNLNFEVRLKIPPNKNNNTDIIGETSCIQYDNGVDPKISCETWYDYTVYEVVCQCQRQGLIINIFDNVLSKASKLKQFPYFNIGMCKILFYKF